MKLLRAPVQKPAIQHCSSDGFPDGLLSLRTNTRYKKSFGTWGETAVDKWMAEQKWLTYRKNLKMRHGEIDRVYFHVSKNKKYFCIAEIKTIYCKNKQKFFSFFTEVGLSALIKPNQISNLYRHAEYLNAVDTAIKPRYDTAGLRYDATQNIFIRFFIVLKMYENYEKESFFQSQTTYKVCLKTKDKLILSFCPELKRT